MYQTLELMRSIPGVEASAVTIQLPGRGDEYVQQFHIAGQDTESEGAKIFADYQTVTPDYFRMLGIPLLAGQTCQLSFDTKAQAQPALVNRSFVDKYFPNQNPIGQHLDFERRFDRTALEIIGVASDIRIYGYAKDPKPAVYWCGLPGFYPDPEYMLKASGDPLLLAEAVRQKIRAIEPNRAVFDVKRLTDYVSSSLTERRFQMMLLSSFAITALLLAAIGLYGVTTFLVSQRTREIGLRVALGAQPTQILAQVFRQGALMTGTGLVAGLACAAGLSRYIASLLFGVTPLDTATFAAVPLLLACVAAVAVWLPARRATRIDPIAALRQE
jgi:predicted permease